MGVETVNTNLRHESTKHFEGIECDIAAGKIHHSLNPTKNFITVEFKFPSIKKHMPSEDYNRIVSSYFHDCMHEMKYKKVSNIEFHRFMNKEGAIRNSDNRSNGETTDTYYSYREREGIDVVRHNEDGKVTTYFNSNIRTLGLLRHDYYMGLLLYANFPVRNFIRRTPCKRFSPDCSDCIKTAKKEVNGWIDDPEPFKPTIDKTFFSFIEDNHRLCMGYTVDVVPSGKTCYKPIEAEYYILDMDVLYFREANYNKRSWGKEIVYNRKNAGETLYSFGGTRKNYDNEYLSVKGSDWRGPHTPLYVAEYNPKDRATVPADIWVAMESKDFIKLWEADIIRFNTRSSAHKYTFNSWWNEGVYSGDGWFCGFKTSETINQSTSAFGSAGKAVAGQLTQVANMFGMSEGAGGSTDSTFKQLKPKIEGYKYEDVVEPLPVRNN